MFGGVSWLTACFQRQLEKLQTDVDAVEQLSAYVCNISDAARDAALLEACLSFFDSLVVKAMPAPRAMRPVLASLCRAVNIDRFCRVAWDVVRGLLSLPNTAGRGVCALCEVLRDAPTVVEALVRRGAVFCLGMACWGSQRIPACYAVVSSVLPQLLLALRADVAPLVAYEIGKLGRWRRLVSNCFLLCSVQHLRCDAWCASTAAS